MTKFYTQDDEWVEVVEGKVVRLGITDFAQDQLGDVVYVELPEVEDEFDAEEEFGSVESVKSASEVLTPFAGTIVKVNEELEDTPELVNEDAEGKGWFVEIELEEEFDSEGLMTKEEYLADKE